MTFSIPMLPADGTSSLVAGAIGAYDTTFATIAKTMINAGFSTAIVRLGWEFNGNWQPWFAGANPKAFIAYYRRIVRVMQSVPGARFVFEWCPNIGAPIFQQTKDIQAMMLSMSLAWTFMTHTIIPVTGIRPHAGTGT